MNITSSELSVQGKRIVVPSAPFEGCTIVVTGRLPRIAQFFDEELIEEAAFPDPLLALSSLREGLLPADIFAFARRPELSTPEYNFPHEWDNLAVVSTTSFDTWWNALPQESRKNARSAAKRGVTVRTMSFDDSLVSGIKDIYDETPVRQGRRFWHFRKDIDDVRAMNATYLDRSQFICAYFDGKLIGFIKYVRVDQFAIIVQILAMEAHRDKRTINALLKHTIEVCQEQGVSTLTYGKFNYGVDRDSSLTEFKRRNGFTEMRFPRYFVPLTLGGRLAIWTGLHLGVRNAIPLPVTTFLRSTRRRIWSVLHKSSKRGDS